MRSRRVPAPFRRLHLLVPALLTAGLAFRAGGFFAGATALAVLTLVLLLVVHVTVARRPFAGWSPALAASAGGLAGLAAWTLASALWSDAPGRAVLEFDRVLLYTLTLVVVGAVAARATDLAITLRWLLAAVLVVAVAGLLTRVLPGMFPISPNIVDERLSFPLTYWNALAMTTGVGLVLAFHVCAAPREPLGARLLAAGAVPVLAVTLLLTFARGPIGVTVGGLALYLVLARPRGAIGALLAVGPPAAFALQRAYGAELLADADYTSPAAVAQGQDVAIVVALCVLAAVALRAALLPVDRRLERVRLPARARRPVLAGAAIAGCLAVVAVAVAADAPGRLESARAEFTSSAILPATEDTRDRLTQLGNNGRIAGWRIARDGFEAAPWRGTGAGTFRLTWEQEREGPFQIVDAHSLYLEVLSELGIPGLVLLMLAIVPLLAGAALRLRGDERYAHAAFLAAGVALLVHAAIDWDWEMPAVFAWFFGAGAVAVAARERAGPARAGPGRLPRVLAGLAVLLLALTPAAVAVSQGPLDRSYRAFLRGDCDTAVDEALASLEALRVRAEPYELLGYCNARAGEGDLAVRAMEAARARDPRNWEYAYGLAIAQAIAGSDPRAAAEEARRRNPQEPLAVELDRQLSSAKSEARRRRIAQRARIPFQ